MLWRRVRTLILGQEQRAEPEPGIVTDLLVVPVESVQGILFRIEPVAFLVQNLSDRWPGRQDAAPSRGPVPGASSGGVAASRSVHILARVQRRAAALAHHELSSDVRGANGLVLHDGLGHLHDDVCQAGEGKLKRRQRRLTPWRAIVVAERPPRPRHLGSGGP